MQNRNPVIAKVLNVLVFLFLYLPIAVLIIFSFNDSKSRTVWSGFSLHWYQELFQDEEILSAFSTTLTVSVLAALIATVLGTAAAIGFHAMKRRPRHLLMTINNIPMTNADIITGVSLMLLFVFTGNMLGFSLGFGTLLVVIAIIRSMVKDKKQGKSSCGANCAHCAMGCGGSCHGRK